MATIKCPRCNCEFKTETEFKANKHYCNKIFFAMSTYELIMAMYKPNYLN